MDRTKGKSAGLYFQAVFAAAVWGAAYPFTKYLVSEISPLSIVAFRAFAGSCLLLALSGARFTAADLRFPVLWRLLVLSALGVSAQQYIQAWALKYTQASHAGWLIASTPIIVAALTAALGERVGVFRAAAFGLGFAGTMLVVSSRGGSFAPPTTRGDMVFLLSCLFWAFYVLLTKRWLKEWPQAKTTAATMLMALATVLPLWAFSGGVRGFAAVTARGWLCFGYLSVLSSAMAYLFWNNAVEGLGPVKTAYFINLEPFATLLSAYLFLGERPGAPAFTGGLLILAGAWLVNLRERTPGWLRGAASHA